MKKIKMYQIGKKYPIKLPRKAAETGYFLLAWDQIIFWFDLQVETDDSDNEIDDFVIWCFDLGNDNDDKCKWYKAAENFPDPPSYNAHPLISLKMMITIFIYYGLEELMASI